ncbi:MAG: class I SAM-dependent methyltransferase [Actinomycetota bacterium]|nr:class I SAM-dependent methyltransferase [Actinomycetota bacterium]
MAAATTRAQRIAAVGFDPAAREREPVHACNLCGSTHLVEVSRRDRYGYEQPLVVCARCGLGFLSPRLSAREYAGFYGDVYRPLVSAYHGRLIDAETVQAEQRDYARDLAAFLERVLPAPPGTILDIGGSTGVVAGEVRAALGCDVTVLDPAPDELAVAEAAGMETIAGFAEDYDPAGRTWGLVLLCQTIDHLLDVGATLRAMCSMLGTDGRAFVDVLDLGFMARRRGSVEGAAKVDHPYYLTRLTALAFFAAAGMAPVAERMSHDGHWGFLLAPAEPRMPPAAPLRAHADALLADLWALRATAS